MNSNLNIKHCPGVQSFLSKKGRFFSDRSAFRASLLVLCAPGNKVTPRAITNWVPCYAPCAIANSYARNLPRAIIEQVL
jgi:hypothetical protein